MPMPIGTARAWGRLRDAFDLKGKHSLQLDEVIVPVAVVADLTEQDPLGDIRPAQGGNVAPATAAVIGQIHLHNPAASPVILELYQVAFGVGAAMLVQMGPSVGTEPTSRAGQFQDRRLSGFTHGLVQFAVDRAAAILVNPTTFRSAADAYVMIPLDVTLPPNTGWAIEGVTINTLLFANFWWRERDPLPNE